MTKPKTLAAFTETERNEAHRFLATKVAFMDGRKFEEGDWTEVYCRAKNIPLRGWSNLEIDVIHNSLGVEQKMLCRRSNVNLMDDCGKTLMHPSATRSIRVPRTDIDPNEAMKIILTQYAEVIEGRRQAVISQSQSNDEADMRTGWLLWQESLRQFLYFEEEMLTPNPDDYFAKWEKRNASGRRKESTNLWIYENETGIKRYSVTTEAGAKIQPYFDVPPPTDPNLFLFTVIGEAIDTGLVRIWLTEGTARELKRQLGELTTKNLSDSILKYATSISELPQIEESKTEIALAISVTEEAYNALHLAFPRAVNDDHCIRILIQFIEKYQ